MNKKELVNHIENNIKDVDDYFKNYTVTYDEIMNDWELQDNENAIFDAGYKSALKNILFLINKSK